jgi:hypothetical protein
VATFKSPKYPGLLVVDVGVRFVDGVAEVSDAKAAAHLRRLSHMGVVEEKPEKKATSSASKPAAKRGRPAKTSS